MKRYIAHIMLLIAVCSLPCAFAGGIALKDRAQALIKNELIKNYPAFSDAKIEIEFTPAAHNLLENMQQNSAGIDLKIDFPQNKRLSSNSAVPFDVYNKGRFEKKIYLQSKIKVNKNILVSAGKIKKGGIISDSDIAFLNKDLLLLPDSVFFDPSLVLGKQAKTYIPSGTILLDWMIRGVPVVKKGDIVEVSAKVNGVIVTSKAEAVEDGYLKDMIKIKNLNTKRIIGAIVINSNKVQAP